MFDLESNISQWRDEMLRAGIGSPVPLEELESHLRDRIESLKSGLPEETAFAVAAQELGDGKKLKMEFSKGRFIRRIRANPIPLNLLCLWFVLGGLDKILQLGWLWRVEWPWAQSKIYLMSALCGIFALQLIVGFAIFLSRRAFWRYCAITFCTLCAISTVWGIVINLGQPAGWDSPGHYFLLLGLSVPMKFWHAVDFSNLCLLVWAFYVLIKSPVRDLFRRPTTF